MALLTLQYRTRTPVTHDPPDLSFSPASAEGDAAPNANGRTRVWFWNTAGVTRAVSFERFRPDGQGLLAPQAYLVDPGQIIYAEDLPAYLYNSPAGKQLTFTYDVATGLYVAAEGRL
ncbi:MAG: hypothetical protein ACYTAN_01835 [Planctomycetota bacterium]